MNYEEWQKMTRLMLDFYKLNPQHKAQIMLMVDGLKYRALAGTDSKV